jgi:NAD+ kinase
MNVALYCRNIRDDHVPVLQNLLDLLAKRKIGVFVYKNFFESVWQKIKTRSGISTFSTHEDIKDKVDYMFSLGGDGTLLDTVMYVRDKNIPVIGINIGRLGFLANIGKDEIEPAIDAIQDGSYIIDKRTMIELESNKPLFGDLKYALNDATIHKKDTSAMIIIHTYINGEFLNSYFADGLIIATPTGSTAYNLSAGGPIVQPVVDAIVLTPIAPHMLTNRPIVIPASSLVRVQPLMTERDELYVTFDGQAGYELRVGDEVRIQCAERRVQLLRPSTRSYFEVLRQKLKWNER